MTDAPKDQHSSRTHRRRRRQSPERTAGRDISQQESQLQITESTLEESPVRPEPLAAPVVRTDEYCVHHMASFVEHFPIRERLGMTKLRHLMVDRFGEARLYCDCLHNGPHEWPPSMQVLQTAIELDQFLADSTSDA